MLIKILLNRTCISVFERLDPYEISVPLNKKKKKNQDTLLLVARTKNSLNVTSILTHCTTESLFLS